MGIADRFKRLWNSVGGASHPDGLDEVRIADPRFDDWEVVRDFGELETARAFRQSLAERGVESVLTADWPLDGFGRGDIALRVPPGRWSAANELLDFD